MTTEERTKLAEIAVLLFNMQRQMVRGCMNHGCRIQEPTGMATNGGCSCTPREFAKRLRDIADRLEERPAGRQLLWTCNKCGDRPYRPERERIFGRGCVCGGTYYRVEKGDR